MHTCHCASRQDKKCKLSTLLKLHTIDWVMVRHYFYAVQWGGWGLGREKAAVGYSFVSKSIISKGCNFPTSGAGKHFTPLEINIFSWVSYWDSFYHRITFYFKVSSNIVQCDKCRGIIQTEKLRVSLQSLHCGMFNFFFFLNMRLSNTAKLKSS